MPASTQASRQSAANHSDSVLGDQSRSKIWRAGTATQAWGLDEPWFGYADFLVRVDGVKSAFGDYAYEIRDTKLARSASASALIQMAHYGAILEKLQHIPPPKLVIWLGTAEKFEWPYRDAAPYLRELRAAFLKFHDDPPETEAVPIAVCGCRWEVRCEDGWGQRIFTMFSTFNSPAHAAARTWRRVHARNSRQRPTPLGRRGLGSRLLVAFAAKRRSKPVTTTGR